MTLLELIKSQKDNEKKKYDFVIYFKDCDIINTSIKITFNQLISIIGLGLENKEIDYKIVSSNLVGIYIKG